jgi:hypothetical protein
MSIAVVEHDIVTGGETEITGFGGSASCGSNAFAHFRAANSVISAFVPSVLRIVIAMEAASNSK